MGQLYQNTVVETDKLGHSTQMSYIMTYQWENYIRLQDTEQLQQDTIDGRIILGHSKWDNCIKTEQLRQLRYDRVDGTVTIGHSRQVSYVMTQQIAVLHQDTVDR